MLVSVIVITYNSSQYVIETLESVKRQSYSDIELIVSDDCSTDNTYDLCKRWLKENTSRFKRSILVKTDKNGGICHNYNNGLKYARGEWIKYIAGDDILRDNCIETYVNKVINYTEKIYICRQQHFSKQNEILEISPSFKFPLEGKTKNKKIKIRKQINFILQHGTIIPGPTLFIERKTLQSLGGFEEKYPFIEDYPLVMKFLKNGFPLGFVDDILIDYRVYSESVSRSNKLFATSIFNALFDYAVPMAKENHNYLYWYHYWLLRKLHKHELHKLSGYILAAFDMFRYKDKWNFYTNKITQRKRKPSV